MDVESLIGALRTQGASLGDAAQQAGPTAAVPTCPGWTVRDLLLHVGGVHRWATVMVGEVRTEPIDLDQPYDIVDELPDDDELVTWFRDGHADLVRTLDQASADVACWAFLPAPSPLAFWARRQVHETTVHRADADAAAGLRTSVPADVAVDGIDELLTCFVSGRNRKLRAKTPRTLQVHATDADADWLIRIGPDRPEAKRVTGDVTADDSVAGSAEELYLALWNRKPWDHLTTAGATPAELAQQWASSVYVRWS
ncbi:MAG TPA: maleylpyruvate isomerase family mycothiol-dependent enzyme [Pseudonocardiaceae bacterium]|nr:maleylpyruvate isomerase family mycothiol-dependent enzyme [Pseudonocardiaceae bacterium]